MRAINPTTLTALEAGSIIDRGMILLDLGSGLYGFWTGLGDFTYSGVTYKGAGSLISVDGVKQTADLSSTQVVARLTAIENTDLTPDVLATIENEVYHQRPCTIYTAYFDPVNYALLSVEMEYRGYIDQVVHTETVDGTAVLEARLESRFRDHQRSGYRVRSHTDQQLLFGGDDGLRHVATVGRERVRFGSVERANPPKKKGGILSMLFG